MGWCSLVVAWLCSISLPTVGQHGWEGQVHGIVKDMVFTVLQSVSRPLGTGRGFRTVSWSLNREHPRDTLGLHPSCLGNNLP